MAADGRGHFEAEGLQFGCELRRGLLFMKRQLRVGVEILVEPFERRIFGVHAGLEAVAQAGRRHWASQNHHAEASDEVQHQVLRVDAPGERAAEHDLRALRDFHPELARDPHRCDFGITNARAQRAETSVDRAMRIGADDEISGSDVPSFH